MNGGVWREDAFTDSLSYGPREEEVLMAGQYGCARAMAAHSTIECIQWPADMQQNGVGRSSAEKHTSIVISSRFFFTGSVDGCFAGSCGNWSGLRPGDISDCSVSIVVSITSLVSMLRQSSEVQCDSICRSCDGRLMVDHATNRLSRWMNYEQL